MNLRTFCSLTIVLFTLLSFSCNSANGQINNPYEIGDSLSYAYGISFGHQLQAENITIKDIDPMELAKALKAILEQKDQELPMNKKDAEQRIRKFQTHKLNDLIESKYQEEEKWFVEGIDNNPKILQTENRVRYHILHQGNGSKPTLSDKIKVHYHGTLLNGKTFDSSKDRGKPDILKMDELIPAWTEILQMMSAGSRWQIYVPFDQAYGAEGSPNIPPYSTLIFYIEFLSIESE